MKDRDLSILPADSRLALDAIAELVADKLVERVAALVAARMAEEPREYRTTGPLPPGIGRKRFNALAPAVAGSRKDGRTWLVPADAWAHARKGHARTVTAAPWTAAKALEAVGFAS